MVGNMEYKEVGNVDDAVVGGYCGYCQLGG